MKTSTEHLFRFASSMSKGILIIQKRVACFALLKYLGMLNYLGWQS